jgi:negative regulator of sigma E activity
MTDRVKEQLSACLDGELPEGELDLLLKQVGRDPELRASLGRYALIGETLRAQGSVAAPADFSRRVAAAIAAEPPLEAAAQPIAARRPVQWLRPAAGFAIAAGVAAVAILSLQQPTPSSDPQLIAESVNPPAVVAEPSASDPASYIVPANTSANSYVPAARLTNYVVAHSEYSSPLGRRSVLSGVLTEEGDAADDTAADIDSSSADPNTQP